MCARSGVNYGAVDNVIQDLLNQYIYDAESRLSTPRTKTCPWGSRLCAVKSLLATAATQHVYDASGTRVGEGNYRALSSMAELLSSPKVLNQIVEFILGQVVGSAVLVVRVVDSPNFFQRPR